MRTGNVRTATPSPYTRFRRDHARVRTRIAALEQALPRGRTRRVRELPLRAQIAFFEGQFATHMAAEEAVLYPALERIFPESGPLLRPLHEEHVELRTMLGALADTLARAAGHDRDEQLAVQVRDFVDLLRIHIRKEEAVVFDVSERVMRPRELAALERHLAPFLPPRAPRARRPAPRPHPRSR